MGPPDESRWLMSESPPTDRRGLVVLTLDECERLLAAGSIGRVSVVSAGEPLILPVLFKYSNRSIAFRTAPGEKLDAAWLNAPTAFEIDDWDTPTRTGWSVLVRGQAEAVEDETRIAELDSLGLEDWVPSEQPTGWVLIHPVEITGRRID